MAKGIYFGVGGIPKKVKEIYIGVGNAPKKVKAAYIGVGNVPKLFYQAGIAANRLFGVQRTSNTSQSAYLYELNTSTGAATKIGNSTYSVSPVGYNLQFVAGYSNRLYIIGESSICEVNPDTGAVVNTSTAMAAGYAIGGTADALFSTGTTTGSTYKIYNRNPDTFAATQYTTSGMSSMYGGTTASLGFEGTSSNLFIASYTYDEDNDYTFFNKGTVSGTTITFSDLTNVQTGYLGGTNSTLYTTGGKVINTSTGAVSSTISFGTSMSCIGGLKE